MNQGGGRGDPFELDPFGESEYDPSVAFAFVAAKQGQEMVSEAERFVRHELEAHDDRTNQYAVSARKSSLVQLADLQEMAYEIGYAKQRALDSDRTSPEFRQAIDDAVETVNRLKGAYDQLMHTAAQIAALDPTLPSSAPAAIDPQTLLDPRPASMKVLTELSDWVNAHRCNDNGDMVVVKATPGVGKTYAMLKLALQEHMSRKRVIWSVRTKEMAREEMRDRIVKMSPFGKMQLTVIHGRDETNCMRHEAVEAVMAHGYAPGPTVCMQCEYYPQNASFFGLGVCPYYEERIRADILAKGARRGFHRQYPFVLTTHASPVAAFSTQGGRWGAFWSADYVFFDEDPTDAMEVDVVLSEAQCSFQSASNETTSAGVVAQLFAEAIEIGKRERKAAESNAFRAPGTKERNTHPIHSKYDSVYTSDSLRSLLNRALQHVAVTTAVGNLGQTLRSVTDSGGFFVQPGTLAQVSSADDINALDIPPKSLAAISEAIGEELRHSHRVRRIVFEQNMGRHPDGRDAQAVLDDLEAHTEVEPMSYTVRLECLPADPEKQRHEDIWQFVVREFRPFANGTASLIIGDAYAQLDHYQQLFDRPGDLIDVTSELNPQASFLRVMDSACNISELRRGGLQRVLALAEAQIKEEVQPGERVLLYGHEELRPHVEQWMEVIAEQRGVTWAFEHWWGGRGKDQYNGWEHTYCLSDPVLSLSGIQHVANARAFRDSLRAKKPDDILLHARRCEVGDDKRGPVHALRASHPRIALEHDRMNVAELTQAMHRSRPAHNAVRVVVYGEMEQSPDLIAQTETHISDASRKRSASSARRKKRAKQTLTTVDSFVTHDEAVAAVCAIIDHYGVYSSWFSHALVAVLSGTSVPSADIPIGTERPGGYHETQSDPASLHTLTQPIDPVVLKDPLIDDGINRVQPLIHGARGPQISGGGRESVPGESRRRRPAGRRGSTEPAPRARAGRSSLPEPPPEVLPNPRSIIERVWHPPVYWRLLIGSRQWPKAIEVAHARVASMAKGADAPLRVVETKHWPKWAKGLMSAGRKPRLFYRPDLLDVKSALREYYRIVETQYGPVQGGRIRRPAAQMDVPGSLSAVPF